VFSLTKTVSTGEILHLPSAALKEKVFSLSPPIRQKPTP
jgi:hypothetical protein